MATDPMLRGVPARLSSDSVFSATLDTVLITHQLRARPHRKANPVPESNALHTLARVMATAPETLLDTLLQLAIDLCQAHTAGISLLETNSSGDSVFRWANLAGTLATYVGGSTPRNFSPCGVCLDHNAPQLFSFPGRYFQYFEKVVPAIAEGLVIPIVPMGKDPLGTIWIVSHDRERRFDSEDVRLMTSLAKFTSSSIRLLRSLGERQEALQQAQREIAKREQVEESLRKSHAELEAVVERRTSSLRMLSARLLRSQDNERRRIARELHDSVGQYLVSLKMNLVSLRRAQSEEAKSALFRDCEDAADQCISETRTISYLLHPPLLEEAGLASAARWYLEGFAQRSGIKTDIDLPAQLDRMPVAVETALFRVLQESLTNVHRHSGSTAVRVSMGQSGGTVVLSVRDFGCGIPSELLDRFRSNGTSAGIGMAGMRERLMDVDGELEMNSGPDGTTIRAKIWLPATELRDGLSA